MRQEGKDSSPEGLATKPTDFDGASASPELDYCPAKVELL